MKQYLVAAAISFASAGAMAQTTYLPTSIYGLSTDYQSAGGGTYGVGRSPGGDIVSMQFAEFSLAGMAAESSVVLSVTLESIYDPAESPAGSYHDGFYSFSGTGSFTQGKQSHFFPILNGTIGTLAMPTVENPVTGAPGAISPLLVTFDVTSLYDAAVARGDTTFGIEISPGGGGDNYNAIYDNFSLTVAAVPEPQTYALMLGGLGLIGWLRRRQGGN